MSDGQAKWAGHTVSTGEEPSSLYEGATNYIADCSCGWHRERSSAENRELAVKLHRAHTTGGRD